MALTGEYIIFTKNLKLISKELMIWALSKEEQMHL